MPGNIIIASPSDNTQIELSARTPIVLIIIVNSPSDIDDIDVNSDTFREYL